MHEADNTSLSVAKVMNVWVYTATSEIMFIFTTVIDIYRRLPVKMEIRTGRAAVK